MKPITGKIQRLRQRRRKDGSWRVWWEAETAIRGLGFSAVELDPDRPSWSVREAEKLNRDVARRRKGTVITTGGRTINDLIEHYLQSRLFRDMRKTTQASYRNQLAPVSAKWGNEHAGHFTKAIMRTWYETLCEASGPWQAKSLVRMMSILFSYAELIGWRPDNSNPCFRLKLRQPAGRSRTATWHELDALVAAATSPDVNLPEIALAVLLSALQGQRQTDVRMARVQDFSQVTLPAAPGRDQETIWIWRWTRSKKQNAGVAPVHTETVPHLEAAMARVKVEHDELLLDSRTGRPISLDLFQKRFAVVRAKAAETAPTVATLQFRDLRRTFGNLARAGGASRDDTADVLGNSAAVNPQLQVIYMDTQFETARRAIDAVKRPGKEEEEKRA